MTDRSEEFEAADVHAPGEDPHEAIDVGEALADVAAVVPTNRERNFTTETTPDSLETVVATEEGLNVARNRGIERAEGDWIVLVDDDVTFPTRLTAMLVDSMHERHLAGLEDFWPMEYVIGRYMVFHRSLWRDAGGFDERRPHGGDTDFAIRCVKAGARVVRLPRHLVPHHDVESEFSKASHAEWLWYLLRRHPRHVWKNGTKLALKNLGLLTPKLGEYPDGWRSQVWIPPDQVEADSGQVEADSGQVEADSGQVEADSGQVEADRGREDADRGREDADE